MHGSWAEKCPKNYKILAGHNFIALMGNGANDKTAIIMVKVNYPNSGMSMPIQRVCVTRLPSALLTAWGVDGAQS